MEKNISDIALIIEGGGMRGTFTAGIINTLLENKIYFSYVAGISSGSSNTVNYLSRDMARVKHSFVDIVKNPNFGGMKSFLKGKGYFSSDFLYDEVAINQDLYPFDFETFFKNPGDFRIGAFHRDSGKMIYFTKKSIRKKTDIIQFVRASSTIPIFMPETKIHGEVYYDGGMGPNGGIPIDIAIKEGFQKFFVIRSRPRHFRKVPQSHLPFIRRYFIKYPHLVKALENRHISYNNASDIIDQLEKSGRAYVVYPDFMMVENGTMDYHLLEKNYELGRVKGKKEVQEWIKFIDKK